METTEEFSMKVIVLTMNRPESLNRLLDSISNTFFEHHSDKLEVEIHVDKSHGNNNSNYVVPPINMLGAFQNVNRWIYNCLSRLLKSSCASSFVDPFVHILKCA